MTASIRRNVDGLFAMAKSLPLTFPEASFSRQDDQSDALYRTSKRYEEEQSSARFGTGCDFGALAQKLDCPPLDFFLE